MEYWIFLNNEKQGPYTLTDLQQVELSPDTLVWRDGLNRWVEAQEIEELEILFATKQPPTFEEEAKSNQSNVNCNNIPPIYLPQEKEVAPPQYYPQPQAMEPRQEQQKPCPPNYLVWAILSTLCCCQPLGIVAIIFAANVNKFTLYDGVKFFNNHDLIKTFEKLECKLLGERERCCNLEKLYIGIKYRKCFICVSNADAATGNTLFAAA